MPEENQDFSRIFGEIKQEFSLFARSYAKAVKGGANVTGEKIMEAVNKSDQPSEMIARELISAVNSGVQYAGEQIIKSGMDFVEHLKEIAKNNNNTSEQ